MDSERQPTSPATKKRKRPNGQRDRKPHAILFDDGRLSRVHVLLLPVGVVLLLLASSPACSFQPTNARRSCDIITAFPRRCTICNINAARCRIGPRTSCLKARYRDAKDEVLRNNTTCNMGVDPNKSGNPLTFPLERFKRLYFLATQRWWHIRKSLRYLVQKYTIYVLACENGKFYVGSTTHKRQRFRQHMDPAGRGGSAWTRLHRPVKVVRQYRRISSKHYLGMEAKVTAEYMSMYGANNVRGAYFSESRTYNENDIESLTGFIGHFNDLPYKEVRSSLQLLLPAAPSDKEVEVERTRPNRWKGGNTERRTRTKMKKKRKKDKLISKATDRCFNCGEMGHWSSECPR